MLAAPSWNAPSLIAGILMLPPERFAVCLLVPLPPVSFVDEFWGELPESSSPPQAVTNAPKARVRSAIRKELRSRFTTASSSALKISIRRISERPNTSASERTTSQPVNPLRSTL